MSFLATADTATLAEGALGVVAVSYFAPPLLKAGADALRGYAGDIPPTTVFDALVSQGAASVLVDIRGVEEKGEAGVPDLPDSSARRRGCCLAGRAMGCPWATLMVACECAHVHRPNKAAGIAPRSPSPPAPCLAANAVELELVEIWDEENRLRNALEVEAEVRRGKGEAAGQGVALQKPESERRCMPASKPSPTHSPAHPLLPPRFAPTSPAVHGHPDCCAQAAEQGAHGLPAGRRRQRVQARHAGCNHTLARMHKRALPFASRQRSLARRSIVRLPPTSAPLRPSPRPQWPAS